MGIVQPGKTGNLQAGSFLLVMVIAIVSFVAWEVPVFAEASGTVADALLPDPGFLEGWAVEGKAESFSRENLYEHIDGEAEMYLPYGFDLLTAAYYGNNGKPKLSVAVDIYRMGSLLDAFGIFSNYRHPEGETVKVGAESEISDYQLVFYQDRYFIRISSSNTGKLDRKILLTIAEAVSKKIPGSPVSPKELELLKTPEISARTEKYVAESLLGYKFFKKGMTAEAALEGKTVKFFVVIAETPIEASATLDLYFADLKKDGVTPVISTVGEKTLTVADPLYKGVVLRQSGRYLMGIAKLEDPGKGIPLLEKWMSRFPK